MIIIGVELLCIFILAMILTTVILEGRKQEIRGMHSVKLTGFWDGDDRRSTERLNISLEVKYFINGKFADVKSVDISRKGIRLMLDEKIEKGADLRLEIKLPNDSDIVKTRGEVVWSKEAKDEKETTKRLFNTGIKFIKTDRNDEKKLFDFIRSLQP